MTGDGRPRVPHRRSGRAVEVGTASFVDPDAAVRIVSEIESLLRAHGVARVRDVVGTIRVS